MKKSLPIVLTVAFAASIVACGDENTTNVTNVTETSGITVVAAGNPLPACGMGNAGEMVFVEDSAQVYYCANGKWMPLKGEQVSSSSYSLVLSFSEESPSSSSVEPSSSSADISSSSAIASSSSERMVSSSSVAVSSSSAESSSSSYWKSNWQYLNPQISYGEFTDERDKKVYKTVQIGSQTWMAENLNFTYNEGTAQSYLGRIGKGLLYRWSAAMDSAGVFDNAGKGCGRGKTCSASGRIRGVCPKGWHLPSDDEWRELFTAVGGKDSAGTKLKSRSGWKDYSGASENGTDEYGFSVLPAGLREESGVYSGAGSHAGFWTSTEYNSVSAYYWIFYGDTSTASLGANGKGVWFSVRCLKD